MKNTKYLVTAEDFEPYKGVLGNINDTDRILPFVREAQELDLKPLIGSALYYDIMTNPATETNEKLINGTEYEYSNDTIFFEGLKPAIIYFAYARFLRASSVHHTSAGIVQKSTPESTPAPDKTVASLVTQATSAGVSFMNEAKKYLTTNRSDYPLFKSSGPIQRKGGVSISAIGGNSNSRQLRDDDCRKIEGEC